jgi:hypothetical protein
MIVNVNELPDNDKRSLEGLLGQPLESGQQVIINVLKPCTAPDDATRRRAAAAIKLTLAEVDARVRANNVSDEEIDAAIEEAMVHVRRRAP